MVSGEGSAHGPRMKDGSTVLAPRLTPDRTTSGAGPNALWNAKRTMRAGVAFTAKTAPAGQPGQAWRSGTSSSPTVTPVTAALDPLLSQFGATTKASWPRGTRHLRQDAEPRRGDAIVIGDQDPQHVDPTRNSAGPG